MNDSSIVIFSSHSTTYQTGNSGLLQVSLRCFKLIFICNTCEQITSVITVHRSWQPKQQELALSTVSHTRYLLPEETVFSKIAISC